MLDGVRGLAALLVVLYHLDWYRSLPTLVERFPGWLRVGLVEHGGSLGVTVFFVLSGFVMASTVSRSGIGGRRPQEFMVRRLRRIMPPYYASIIFVVVVAAAAAAMKGEVFGVEGSPLTLDRVLAHLFLAQQVLGIEHLTSVYWTLTYELAFYVSCAAVMWATARVVANDRRRGRILDPTVVVLVGVAVISVVVSIGHGQGELGAFSFLRMSYTFVLGVLTFAATRRRTLLPLLGAFALAVAATGMVVEPEARIAGLATAGLLLAASLRGTLDIWLCARPLRALGKISFSLYLTHAPVLATVGYLTERTAGSSFGAQLLQAVGGVAASLIVAWAMWWLVERPAVAWSAAYRRTAPSPGALELAQPNLGHAVVGGLAQRERGPLAGRFDVVAQVAPVDVSPDRSSGVDRFGIGQVGVVPEEALRVLEDGVS